jgi:pimeloyl-ACP methyl ester carboxylesterase
VLAALNGVFGDYLAATDNPLSTPMHLPEWPTDARQPLVLLHGLCMNGAQWQRDGADFAAALARLGHAPVALTYNSGLTIAENGWQLAELLEARLAGSAERDLSLVGHSMGGLVARSAIHQAQAAGMAWPRRLRRLVTLGTPHHGAPLERGGQQLQQLLALTPYARPLAHLAQRRSAGIRDLRYGCLLAADSGKASRIPLPEGVECYAVAACTAERLDGLPGKMLGDGLVPVPSALGQHRQVAWRLAFDDTATIVKLGHLALQTDPRVLAQLQAWLGD